MATKLAPIEHSRRTFLPAAGRDWLLPFYDPFVKLLGGDQARQRLLDQAALQAGHRVLDIGCGTGTFAVLIKRLHPDVEVIGLDPDPKALARAHRKAEQDAVTVEFDQGFSDTLPYAEATFDRAFSSYMFHHLEAEEKAKTLREVRRVLKPGGSLHLLDFEEATSSDGGFMRWLHAHHRLQGNSADQLLALMRQAEFTDPHTTGRGAMFFGLMAYVYYQASTS